jgi:hypothetical protein
MSAIATICPNDWWLASGIVAVLVMLAILWRWRRRELIRKARSRAARTARELETKILQESMLQASHGMILRFDAIARKLPPDHPARRDIGVALDRAERALEIWQDRAQNLRDGADGTHGSDSSKTP